jgi:hypothetical protein
MEGEEAAPNEENQTIEEDDEKIVVGDGLLVYQDPRIIYTKQAATISFPLEGGRAFGEIISFWQTENKNCPNNIVEQTFKLEGVYDPATGFSGVAVLTGNSTTYDAYCNQSDRVINNSEFVWYGEPAIKIVESNDYEFYILLKGPNSESLYQFVGK